MTRVNRRRTDGDETWNRLIEWTKGQKAAERLGSSILNSEGYTSIDPSHPLGGRDGIKDIVCAKDGMRWIGACYFPRGQKLLSEIKDKFSKDYKGIEKNGVDGIIFITNQELSLSERKSIATINKGKVEIYHLERIVHLLNCPQNYGVRLEFLDIEMTQEEQLSYFAYRDTKMDEKLMKFENFMADYRSFKEELLEDDFRIKSKMEEDIVEAIEELFDKVWYNRHLILKYKVENGSDKVDPEIWANALKAAKKVERKYGKRNLGPWTDFEWGMINGKLSALRWVLGDEWDMLDT